MRASATNSSDPTDRRLHVARYETTIASPWRPEEAFAYLADFSNVEQWDPGVDRAERLDDEIRLGTRFRVEVSALGRRVPLQYRIVELTSPWKVVLLAETPTFRSRDTVTVVPTATGCDLTYVAELRFRGLIGVADPVLRIALRRIGDRAAAGLERAIGVTPSPVEGTGSRNG